jgi:4,5-DOPA dioxygenase extradiol
VKRKQFIQTLLSVPIMGTLSNLKAVTDVLPTQEIVTPVLFTSHGNPMDIPMSRDERPFWKTLFELGKTLQTSYDIRAVIVVSAHWCTRGTYVNVAAEQEQIYDYYGFPKEYYDVIYHANGSPIVAQEVKRIVPSVSETTEWGLDHGAWPMLMHLFPLGNIPVFQLSLDYYAKPEYHYELGKQLKSLRKKGVLIIGSGSLIHNLRLAGQKMMEKDFTPYGWEAEYDAWIKKQLDERNIKNILNYESSHKLGKLAAPTPDHFVPVLYSLGLMNDDESLTYFFESESTLPAFSERSFILSA